MSFDQKQFKRDHVAATFRFTANLYRLYAQVLATAHRSESTVHFADILPAQQARATTIAAALQQQAEVYFVDWGSRNQTGQKQLAEQNPIDFVFHAKTVPEFSPPQKLDYIVAGEVFPQDIKGHITNLRNLANRAMSPEGRLLIATEDETPLYCLARRNAPKSSFLERWVTTDGFKSFVDKSDYSYNKVEFVLGIPQNNPFHLQLLLPVIYPGAHADIATCEQFLSDNPDPKFSQSLFLFKKSDRERQSRFPSARSTPAYSSSYRL